MPDRRDIHHHESDRDAQWGSREADLSAVKGSDNVLSEAREAIKAADAQLRALRWFHPGGRWPEDR